MHVKQLGKLILSVLIVYGSLGCPKTSLAANVCTVPQAVANSRPDVPHCPSLSPVQGLDNTYPSGGIFIVLEPAEENEFALAREAYQWVLKQNGMAKLNVVLEIKTSVTDIEAYLDSDADRAELKSMLADHDHVNVLSLDYPFTQQTWIQD